MTFHNSSTFELSHPMSLKLIKSHLSTAINCWIHLLFKSRKNFYVHFIIISKGEKNTFEKSCRQSIELFSLLILQKQKPFDKNSHSLQWFVFNGFFIIYFFGSGFACDLVAGWQSSFHQPLNFGIQFEIISFLNISFSLAFVLYFFCWWLQTTINWFPPQI